MADLATRLHGDGSVVDRSTILYPFTCRSGMARATTLVPTGQIPPQGLALLGGAIDEGVDRLAAQRPQPGFVPRLEPARDLFGHPSLGEPVADKPTKIWISLEDGLTLPTQLIGPVGVKRRIPARGQRVPPQLSRDCRFSPAQLLGDRPQRAPSSAPNPKLVSLRRRQVRVTPVGEDPKS